MWSRSDGTKTKEHTAAVMTASSICRSNFRLPAAKQALKNDGQQSSTSELQGCCDGTSSWVTDERLRLIYVTWGAVTKFTGRSSLRRWQVYRRNGLLSTMYRRSIRCKPVDCVESGLWHEIKLSKIMWSSAFSVQSCQSLHLSNLFE